MTPRKRRPHVVCPSRNDLKVEVAACAASALRVWSWLAISSWCGPIEVLVICHYVFDRGRYLSTKSAIQRQAKRISERASGSSVHGPRKQRARSERLNREGGAVRCGQASREGPPPNATRHHRSVRLRQASDKSWWKHGGWGGRHGGPR